MPSILERLRHALQGRLRPVTQSEAIAALQRTGALTPSEAHALRAGDSLFDLHTEIVGLLTDGVCIGAQQLEEIAALIAAGDLAEAVIQLGRLHPALRDLPHLFQRSATRARA